MVKKLYKHEIEAYLRVWIPMQIILLGVALLGRIIQFFEVENVAYNVINGSAIFAFVLAVIVSIGLTFVFSIVRFYKNLFTTEGYLSFTLPVTPTTHILTKLVTAVAFQLATLVVALLAIGVITAGDVFYELTKAIAYLWNLLSQNLGTHLPFYVMELVVLLIVALFTTLLLYYTCLAVGQLGNKNRILLSVGVFFGYYFVTQILGTIVVVVGVVLPESWWDPIVYYFENHTLAAMHWVFCGCIVWYALLGVAYAFLTRYILRNKLNLE